MPSSLKRAALAVRPECICEFPKQGNDRCKEVLCKINIVEWQMDWILKRLEKQEYKAQDNKSILDTCSVDA